MEGTVYKASCNLFWLDLNAQSGTSDSRTPLSPKQIQGLEDHYFRTPAPIHKDIVVPLTEGVDPLKEKGSLGGNNNHACVVI